MADYSTIKGFTVQALASDPYASEVLGATWASGTDFPSTTVWGAGFGIQTAAVYGFGLDNPGAYVRTTFEYDGTTWAGPATVNRATGAACAGLGTQTAGLIAGGTTTPPNAVVTLTETYDGSSWSTSPGTLNTARTNPKGTGTTTAGIIFGGTTGLGSGPTQPAMNNTETWNGSAWTETNDMNTARNNPFSLGTTNPASTAVTAGGQTGATLITDAETWDGTSWTEVNNINTGRAAGGGASDSNTTGIIFGGKGPVPTANALTESWDGTSWTEVADLATARLVVVGTGTGTSGFAIGGQTASAKIAGTEEFSAPAATVIASEGQVWYNSGSAVLKGFGKQGTGAWASATSMPIGLEYGGLAGIQTAAVFWGGVKSPPGSPVNQNTTFEYDGTSWTAGNPTPTVCANTGGVGIQTAAAGFGNEAGYSALTIEYDGTSWAAGVNRPFVAGGSANFGTQTAAISATGYNPGSGVGGNLVDVAHYDGTSWTTGTNYPTNTSAAMGAGTQTAGVVWGGYAPGIVTTTTTYDGTTWSPSGALNEARFAAAGGGSQTGAINAGGGSPAGVTVNTEIFNGSTWTEVANLGTKAGYQAKGFSHTAAATTGFISAGGTNSPPGFIATVEEYTVPDAIKTFTAS